MAEVMIRMRRERAARERAALAGKQFGIGAIGVQVPRAVCAEIGVGEG